MGLLSSAMKSPFLWRRALVEARAIRRALERIADVLELQAQQAPRAGGQSFRGLSRSEQSPEGDRSSISYTTDRDLAEFLAREDELTALLGRAPTELELERALRGEIE
jgi:phosphate uptake regulator